MHGRRGGTGGLRDGGGLLDPHFRWAAERLVCVRGWGLSLQAACLYHFRNFQAYYSERDSVSNSIEEGLWNRRPIDERVEYT